MMTVFANLIPALAVTAVATSAGGVISNRMTAAQQGGAQQFTDPNYGFSLRIPRTWKPSARAPVAGPTQRLSLSTSNDNILIVSVTRLPRPVHAKSDFEPIGAEQVEPVVKTYLKSFGFTTVLGEKKEDHSDTNSLRFWQGTSALYQGLAPGMLISLHAIKLDSNVMVNIVFVGASHASDDIKAVDTLMTSLAFTAR